MKKTNNIIFTVMIALLFAFGITITLGSSAYAFQNGQFIKHSALTKKTSKKSKKRQRKQIKKSLK